MTQMFRTEADVMLATAGHVDTTNNEVQGELTRLQGVVDGVRGSWAGSAQVSFDGLMQRWNTSARELREALTSISDNIRHNSKAQAYRLKWGHDMGYLLPNQQRPQRTKRRHRASEKGLR